VCCSVSQYVAVCSVLQSFAVTGRGRRYGAMCCSMFGVCCKLLQYVAVCCSNLEQVQVCCSVLRCKVFCIVWQCFAARCNVFQKSGRGRRCVGVCGNAVQCVKVCYSVCSLLWKLGGGVGVL